jgi:hypothetical protein
MEKSDEPASGVIVKLLDAAVASEVCRKSSLEQRALAVITSSGVLVTLLFGLAALVTKTTSFILGPPANYVLAASCFLFLVAAGFGLAANWPRNYTAPTVDSLREYLDEQWWNHRRPMAERSIAESQLEDLATARRFNRTKANLLTVALALEVVAVVVVAAVAFVLLLVGSAAVTHT